MLSLTKEERKVILFLIFMALLGLGISFCIKIKPRTASFIKIEQELVKMDINKITPEDLAAVKGVSKRLAQSIVEYRDANGPFRTIEELKEVKGVGDCRLEKLKGLFFVE